MTELTFTRFEFCWGGQAGDGLQSAGLTLSKYFNRLGYYVHGVPGTQSTIRGGHIFELMAISTSPIHSHNRELDLVVAFTTQTLEVHLRDLKQNGFLIYNSDAVEISKYADILKTNKIRCIDIPLTSLQKKIGPKITVLINTIAIGAIIGFLGLPKTEIYVTIEKQFSDKKHEIIDLNKKAFDTGFEYIQNVQDTHVQVEKVKNPIKDYIVISGNEVIAIAAVASGLKFLAQYPITPASSIFTYMANHARQFGVVTRQAEDELAALTMVVGAAYAGVRSMTATSGPGFSLMAETLGYAGSTETPCVLVVAMRCGPSTGVPTKMEQADLFPAMYASHGESPRAIIAPRTIEECFEATVKAFNIADCYQLPVILLSDFYLSEHTENIPPFNLNVKINRGKIWTETTEEFPTFKRFAFTEDGISPRAFPPNPEAIHVLVGAEHDEESHSLSGNRCGLPKSGILREKMFEKRFKKLEKLKEEMEPPKWFGTPNADKTIICWGSVTGAAIETIEYLNTSSDKKWNVLAFRDMFPLPEKKVLFELNKIKFGIMLEVYYTGQLQDLLYLRTGWKPQGKSIHPISGEAPTRKNIVQYLQKNGEI